MSRICTRKKKSTKETHCHIRENKHRNYTHLLTSRGENALRSTLRRELDVLADRVGRAPTGIVRCANGSLVSRTSSPIGLNVSEAGEIGERGSWMVSTGPELRIGGPVGLLVRTLALS